MPRKQSRSQKPGARINHPGQGFNSQGKTVMNVHKSALVVLIATLCFVVGCDMRYQGSGDAATSFVAGDAASSPEDAAGKSTTAGKAGPESTDEETGQAPEEAGEYGLARRYVVHVYEKPSDKSKLVGILRKGSVVPVSAMQDDLKSEDCTGGWVYLPSGKGYVCKSRGLKVEDGIEKQEGVALHTPWYDALLPYDYGRIGKNDLPAYNRFPTAAEKKQVQAWLAERRAVLTAQFEAVKKAMEDGDPVPNPYEPIELKVSNEKGEETTVATSGEWSADVEDGPVPTEIPFSFVEKILLHGFYVSIGHRMYRDGQAWIKTVRGHTVPSGSIRLKASPPTRGIELNEGSDLPIVIVKKTKATVFEFDTGGGRMKPAGETKLKRFDAAPILEKLEYGGTNYLKIGPERFVKQSDVKIVEKSKPPSIVKSDSQKWIDVDVSKQVLVAYEGQKAVYAALVSTGKEKVNEEFKTPRGVYSILSKHVTGTMANLYASDGPYMIEDVPWTMYFLGSYALHGAFWHNGFGGMRSHGCINLPPYDARWIFYWADPELPEGWHSVYARGGRKGTIIKIHD